MSCSILRSTKASPFRHVRSYSSYFKIIIRKVLLWHFIVGSFHYVHFSLHKIATAFDGDTYIHTQQDYKRIKWRKKERLGCRRMNGGHLSPKKKKKEKRNRNISAKEKVENWLARPIVSQYNKRKNARELLQLEVTENPYILSKSCGKLLLDSDFVRGLMNLFSSMKTKLGGHEKCLSVIYCIFHSALSIA